MRTFQNLFLATKIISAALVGVSCATTKADSPKSANPNEFALTRAVLYQNGVGYFERQGKVEGDRFTVRIRADQVNDFLKSLTVIDSTNGKAVSVSLPLDRSAAAHVMELAQRLKEEISLPEIIGLLKGTEISLMDSSAHSISGRLLAVEELPTFAQNEDGLASLDWRVSVMGKNTVQTVLLSEVTGLSIKDDFITLGLHKGLDAAATGGVFKVVDVEVRLDRPDSHQILVSYVVECPAWKPTYRLVLDEGQDVLLQGWAVVDNVTGEGWDDISLSLTSGAPLAFRYDLYSPKFVDRPDLSAVSGQKVARADVGESAYGAPQEEAYSDGYAEAAADDKIMEEQYRESEERSVAKKSKRTSAPMTVTRMSRAMAPAVVQDEAPSPVFGGGTRSDSAVVSIQSLQDSVQSMVKASSASGAVRYDMTLPISVPDRSSTLVSILNHKVKGEEVFLYKPGGSGQGYEQNPYRVVRFKNTTGFMLEPGPISIYSGGSFVGEGIAETISDGRQAIIPFAVDASILVTSDVSSRQEGARLLRIFNRQIWVESFERIKTSYKVKGGDAEGYRLYVRHTKALGNYEFKDMPKGTEDVGDAYLVPIDVKPKALETVYTVVEQTPVTKYLTIWDGDARNAVSLLIENTDDLNEEMKAKLSKALEVVAQVSEIDIRLQHLQTKKWEIDERMEQTRENLKSLKNNKAAGDLKAKLAKSLSELAKEGESVTKSIVQLNDERSALTVSADQLIGEITFGK